MKIYKIANEIIPQNPSGATDPAINLQNLQNAQNALPKIDAIKTAAEKINSAIKELEDALGGDTGMAQDVSNKIYELLAKDPDISLLQHMNLLPNINDLYNADKYLWLKNKITNDLPSAQQAVAQKPNPSTNTQVA